MVRELEVHTPSVYVHVRTKNGTMVTRSVRQSIQQKWYYSDTKCNTENGTTSDTEHDTENGTIVPQSVTQSMTRTTTHLAITEHSMCQPGLPYCDVKSSHDPLIAHKPFPKGIPKMARQV